VTRIQQPHRAAEANDPGAHDHHPLWHAAESAAPGRFLAREVRATRLATRLAMRLRPS
jgi:hypothetical protein